MSAPYGMHVIVAGNPVTGFEFYGPFTTGEAAKVIEETYSTSEETWWVAPLHAVEELTGRTESAESELPQEVSK